MCSGTPPTAMMEVTKNRILDRYIERTARALCRNFDHFVILESLSYRFYRIIKKIGKYSTLSGRPLCDKPRGRLFLFS